VLWPQLLLSLRFSAADDLPLYFACWFQGPAAELLVSRYAAPLAQHHDDEHLTKFELLLEASIDLEAVPQEYLISAQYDARLQVTAPNVADSTYL